MILDQALESTSNLSFHLLQCDRFETEGGTRCIERGRDRCVAVAKGSVEVEHDGTRNGEHSGCYHAALFRPICHSSLTACARWDGVMHKKVAVAVLGGTGLVGQRLIHLLADHPWFELIEIGASERSSGKSYRDAVAWKLPTPIPAAAALLPVKRVDPTAVTAPVVFSALDGAVADEVEVPFAKAGRAVISNARSHRMDPDVPLLVPEVNPSHLGVLAAQRERFGGGGLIVTNPNCSVIGLCLALAPLMRERRLLQLVVTTLQAASGAGYPGVPALDLIDNVIPFIGGEEEKLEIEPQKIFGTIQGGRIVSSATAVSAHVHRVPVSDGHTLAVSAAFALSGRAPPQHAGLRYPLESASTRGGQVVDDRRAHRLEQDFKPTL